MKKKLLTKEQKLKKKIKKLTLDLEKANRDNEYWMARAQKYASEVTTTKESCEKKLSTENRAYYQEMQQLRDEIVWWRTTFENIFIPPANLERVIKQREEGKYGGLLRSSR